MLKISTETEGRTNKTFTRIVECPVCGKQLVDVRYADGIAMLCIKCSRCRHLIKINITD